MHGLLFQNLAESLFRKGICIEDLVAAAGRGGQGNQKIWFAQGQQLTDGIGSGSGDDDIGCCEQML